MRTTLAALAFLLGEHDIAGRYAHDRPSVSTRLHVADNTRLES